MATPREVVVTCDWRRRLILLCLLAAGASSTFPEIARAAENCADTNVCKADDKICNSICALRKDLEQAASSTVTQQQIRQGQELLGELLTFQKGDPTAAVKAASTKLADYIGTDQTVKPGIIKTHDELRGALGTLKKRIELIEQDLPLDAALKRVESLTTLLKNPDFLAVYVGGHASDAVLTSKLQELLTEVLNVGKGNPTATVTSASGKLATFIKSNIVGIVRFDATLRDALLPKVPAAAGDNSLLFNIEDIEADLPDKAAIRRAESLQTILSKAGDTPEQAPYKAALSKADVLSKLGALKPTIDALLKPLEPRIHIISAYYGGSVCT